MRSPRVSVAIAVDGGPAHDAVVEVIEEVALGWCGRGGGVVAQGIDADEVGATVDGAEEAGRAVALTDEGAASAAARSKAWGDGEIEDVVGAHAVGVDVVVEDVGSEALHGKEVKVVRAVFIGEIAGAVHGVPAKVVRRGRPDDGAGAVDELEVEMEVGAFARGPFAYPEGILNGVVTAGAQLVEVGVDLRDEGLGAKVDTPDGAGVGVAAVDVLAVVGHVAHVVVGVAEAGDVELFDEVAVEVVFVEHRQHVRRLAPDAGVYVFAVVHHAMLASCGANERVDEVPLVARGLLLGLRCPWRDDGEEKD